MNLFLCKAGLIIVCIRITWKTGMGDGSRAWTLNDVKDNCALPDCCSRFGGVFSAAAACPDAGRTYQNQGWGSPVSVCLNTCRACLFPHPGDIETKYLRDRRRHVGKPEIALPEPVCCVPVVNDKKGTGLSRMGCFRLGFCRTWSARIMSSALPSSAVTISTTLCSSEPSVSLPGRDRQPPRR